ncbi:MAG TPA: hypothetical protein VFL79_05830 [Terriglobia bacterium]|nr:hypothetical protein [Terriglobia bacterium]
MARTIRSITARFVRNYERNLPRYKKAATAARKLIRAILSSSHVQIHLITSRCKKPESLRLKLRRKRYRQPGQQLTDIVGVRVITFFENDIPGVVQLLLHELEINQHKSEDKRTKLDLKEFGYLSVHLIARTKGRWARSPAFAPIRGMWFEIQVRSILEHAWAEIEHEIVYKSAILFPKEIKRRFARLAGALEILESEFIALRRERSKLIDTYVAEFQKGTKLNRDTLDSAKLIAMLEVERPSRVGWRSTPADEAVFPHGIEAMCTEALKVAGIRSSSALRQALRSRRVKSAEMNFSTLALQAPTHLATVLIVLAAQSPVIFRDFFPDMAANPNMAALMRSLRP